MPDRDRRAGARPGRLSDTVRQALREEARRLDGIVDPVEAAVAVGDAFAALDRELEQLAAVRLRALRQLRAEGWSYDRIAAATGLSKGRVAQLARASRAAN